MLWLGPALVFYVAVAAALVSKRRLGRIDRLRLRTVRTLVSAIRSRDRRDLERARSNAPADSFEELVLAAVLSDDPTPVRVATVNEHLGDVDRELDGRRDVRGVAGRTALLSGTLGSVVELSLTLPSPDGPAWAPAAASFVLGLAGWMVAAELERRAAALSGLARSEWDSVALALGDAFSSIGTEDETHGTFPSRPDT